jgi:Holliday junction DNA helicase RuvB
MSREPDQLASAEDALRAQEEAYVESRALVDAEADGDERAVEAALRPRSLDEVIGQERVREQLSLVLQAARARTTCCSRGRPGSARPPWR